MRAELCGVQGTCPRVLGCRPCCLSQPSRGLRHGLPNPALPQSPNVVPSALGQACSPS